MRRHGPVGRITLDRPRQINALTLPMIERAHAALVRWESDPRVETILLDGHGEPGFCAGGDIRVVHDAARDRTGAAETLWRAEYLLVGLLADYRKPVVTLLDGITMGGGIGLGAHGSHRVVTERSTLAMPEVRIGIAPDVGGLLLDALLDGPADAALDGLRAAPGRPGPAGSRLWMDACYDSDDAGEIVARLRRAGVAEAAAAADRIEAASPLAVCVTLRALAGARRLDALPEVLAQDLRVGLRFLDRTDPVEGIRAVLDDKGRRPAWSPPSIERVPRQLVDRHFAALGAAELDVRRDMRTPPGGVTAGTRQKT